MTTKDKHKHRDKNMVRQMKNMITNIDCYDLKLVSFTENTTTIFTIFSIIEVLQRISLLLPNFEKTSTKSSFHKSLYGNLVPEISLQGIFQQNKRAFLVGIFIYLIPKYFYFLSKFGRKAKTLQQRGFDASQMRIIFSFFFFDYLVIRTPIFDIAFFFITCDSSNSKLSSYLEMPISIAIVLVFLFQNLTFLILSYDFERDHYSYLRTRTLSPKILHLVVTVTLSIIRNITINRGGHISLKILNNLIALIFSCFTLRDFYTNLHFIESKHVKLLRISTEVFFCLQSLVALLTSIFPEFSSRYDFDLFFVIFSLILTHLFEVLIERKKDWILQRFVFKIENAKTADQYLDMVKMLFKLAMKKIEYRLKIFKILAAHFQSCQESSCLCCLMKVEFGSLFNYESLEAWIKSKSKVEFEGRYFDYNYEVLKDSINKYKNEFQLPKGTKRGELINYSQKVYHPLISNFYSLLLKKFKGELFRFFISYINFEVFDRDNSIGSLILTYRYRSSYKFLREKNIYKTFIIENYLKMVKEKLINKAKRSNFELTANRFTDLYDFSNRVKGIKVSIKNIINHKHKMFEELSKDKIDYKQLIEQGQRVFEEQTMVEESFDEMRDKANKNLDLLRIMIMYYRLGKMVKKSDLKEIYDKIDLLKKHDRLQISLTNQLKLGMKINLFSERNMVMLVGIKDLDYRVEKFSKNLPDFFGYSSSELVNMKLSKLMHYQIARKHDGYIKNFLNRKKGTRLRVRHFTAFGKRKDERLLVVNLVVKLEFLQLDDIYLCSLVNDDRKNKNLLCLAEHNGNVISMNSQCEDVIGTEVYKSRHSLFIKIPTLLKVFYPEVVKHVNFKKVTRGKKRKRKYKKIRSKKKDRREKKNNFDNLIVRSESINAFMVGKSDEKYDTKKDFLKMRTSNHKRGLYNGKNLN